MLGFPTRDAKPDRAEFDNFHPESEVIQGVRELGYSHNFWALGDFNKRWLPPHYYTLYTIISRCLTGKNSGIDSTNINMLTFFYGIVNDFHYDYAQLIFNEIEEMVRKRRYVKYLPFQRFFSRLVKSTLRGNRDIPRRADHPKCPFKPFLFIRYQDDHFDYERPLIVDFIRYADP